MYNVGRIIMFINKHYNGSHFSISRFTSNRLHFVKFPESSRKPINCAVRNHCLHDDSWVLPCQRSPNNQKLATNPIGMPTRLATDCFRSSANSQSQCNELSTLICSVCTVVCVQHCAGVLQEMTRGCLTVCWLELPSSCCLSQSLPLSPAISPTAADVYRTSGGVALTNPLSVITTIMCGTVGQRRSSVGLRRMLIGITAQRFTRRRTVL